VYAFGNVSKAGKIYFNRDEEFTLNNLIAKTRANISSETEEILVKSEDLIKNYNIEKIETLGKKITLSPGDIVYFKPYQPFIVNVFGLVNNPGVKTFQKLESRNLMTVLAKCGGFRNNAGKNIKIITPDGYINEINYSEMNDPSSYILENGSYITINDNTDNFIAIFGDVKRPGIRYVDTPILSLLEALGEIGGVNNWVMNTTIEITRKDGRKEVISTDENPAKLSEDSINSGDVIYVVPSSKLKIYVFGSVIRPGVLTYHSNMTLLEAILSCGGANGNAYLKEVLYFPGGISNNPVVVDMTKIENKQISKKITLKPEDVIYVSENAMVDIANVVNFLKGMMQFTSSGIVLMNQFGQ